MMVLLRLMGKRRGLRREILSLIQALLEAEGKLFYGSEKQNTQ